MDFLHSLYRRETGRCTINTYDPVIKRLKCYSYNEFYDVFPNILGRNENEHFTVSACEFCCKENNEQLLALANEEGLIALQDTNLKQKSTKELTLLGTPAHDNAIFDLAWMEGELQLVSASGDHTAVLWDVTMCRQLRCFKGHTRSVKTVVFRPQDKAVFATGARDGVIMVWDTRSNPGPSWNRPDNFISNSHPALEPDTPSRNRRTRQSTCSITGLVFQDQNCLISCGDGDGLIKVWDLRKNYSAYRREPVPRHVLRYSGSTACSGFTHLALDPGRVKLYASCMDSVIYCYNVATYEAKPISTFIGHQNFTFYVKSCLSPDGLYLVSGSSDHCAYIWNTQGLKTPIATLVGHGEEVTCVQWCPAGTKLVTCSDDARHRIWEVGLEFESENDEVQLRGWAETPTITRSYKEKKDKKCKIVEVTPRSIKLRLTRQEKTPEFVCSHVDMTDMQKECSKCSSNEQKAISCGGCTESARESPRNSVRTSKRRLSDLLEKDASSSSSTETRPVLSPVREGNQEDKVGMETRRARRLFSPRKRSDSTHVQSSINSIQSSPQPDPLLFSPTSNLPNYVLDGTSPRHHCSPNMRHKENVDWLTKLSKEKTGSVEKSYSVRAMPKRRHMRSRQHEVSRSSSPKGTPKTLLHYFRVSGKPKNESLSQAAAQEGNSLIEVIEL